MGKRKDFLSEIDGKNPSELYDKAREISEDQLKIKIRHATGQLETPHRINENRKNVARVLTKINESKSKEVKE